MFGVVFDSQVSFGSQTWVVSLAVGVITADAVEVVLRCTCTNSFFRVKLHFLKSHIKLALSVL